eukprot:COSAG02_NODE_18347_length_944_cov_3.556088_2_plen_82_part_00
MEEARERVKLEEFLMSKVEENAVLRGTPFTEARAKKLLRAAEAMEPLPPSGRTGHRQYRLHYHKRFKKEGKSGRCFACGTG